MFRRFSTLRLDVVNVESADFDVAAEMSDHSGVALRAGDALHLAVCRRAGTRLATLRRRTGRSGKPPRRDNRLSYGPSRALISAITRPSKWGKRYSVPPYAGLRQTERPDPATPALRDLREGQPQARRKPMKLWRTSGGAQKRFA